MPGKKMLEDLNIAIDGVSGCGKSSTAKHIAKILELKYLDTGAMYRAVTFSFLENAVNLSNEKSVREALKRIDITVKYSEEKERFETYLNGRNVEDEIRQSHIADNVSYVSSIPEVRKFLVEQQQSIARKGGVIMDGRDIGTKVMARR